MQHVRSFVRRGGRITRSQKNALDKYWDKYGVAFKHDELDLDRLFNRNSPKILDIGSGNGDSTIIMASNNPENDYLAVEVHKPGIGRLLRQIHSDHLKNIRIINHDVIEVIEFQLLNNSLDSVFIFFPDPWPKKRHHKRRLIDKSFLERLSKKLKRNARVFLATDWENYAANIRESIENTPGFINLSGKYQYAPRPYWRPLTKFENRGKKLQHQVRELVFAYVG